jgi:hypothetical protein
MAHQTTLTRGARPTNGADRGLLGGVGAFGSDLATLSSLQARLFTLDLAEAGGKAGPALAVLVIGVLTLPIVIALAAVSLVAYLAAETTLSLPVACLVVAGGLLVLILLAAFISYLVIRRSLAIFRRSTEELQRNMSWVMTVLNQSGR